MHKRKFAVFVSNLLCESVPAASISPGHLKKNGQMPGPAGNFCWQMPWPRSFYDGQMPCPQFIRPIYKNISFHFF